MRKDDFLVIGKIFCVLVSISFVFGAVTGRMSELSASVIEGAQSAVQLSLSLLGVMCLWSGAVAVLEKTGVVSIISSAVRPIVLFIYPSARRNACAADSIAANFAANFLGLGNAALPTGIRAMEALAQDGGERASVDMMTFAVMNTVPFQLLPTTLCALRSAAGAPEPFSILVPVWLTSVITMVFAASVCRILGSFFERRKNE